jgi:hypothetical protein
MAIVTFGEQQRSERGPVDLGKGGGEAPINRQTGAREKIAALTVGRGVSDDDSLNSSKGTMTLLGSCTLGIEGPRLWPNNLDTTSFL